MTRNEQQVTGSPVRVDLRYLLHHLVMSSSELDALCQLSDLLGADGRSFVLELIQDRFGLLEPQSVSSLPDLQAELPLRFGTEVHLSFLSGGPCNTATLSPYGEFSGKSSC